MIFSVVGSQEQVIGYLHTVNSRSGNHLLVGFCGVMACVGGIKYEEFYTNYKHKLAVAILCFHA
jgi:hypothetical protein